MAQFYLSSYRQGNCTAQLLSGPTHALLMIEWQLKRQMGFFMLQVYLPCTLIVILSWVAFWLNREATSDRVNLGIMSVLTLSTLGIDARKDLPKMSHGTALDWFLIICYVYVSASLVVFCVVHYFTKVNNSGEEPVILQLTRQHQAAKHRRKIRQILLHEHRQRQHQRAAAGGGGPWSIVSSSQPAETLYRTRPNSVVNSRRSSIFHTQYGGMQNNNSSNSTARYSETNDIASPKSQINRMLLSPGTLEDIPETSASELPDSYSHDDDGARQYSDDDGDGVAATVEGEEVYGDDDNDQNAMWYRDVYGRQCRVPSSGRVLGVVSQHHHQRDASIVAGSLRRPSSLEPVPMVQMYSPERRPSLLQQGESVVRRCFYCVVGNEQYRYRQATTRRKTTDSHNNVSMVDRISRVVFPLSFLIVNLIYWTSFRSDDVLSDDANREWQTFMNCTVAETKKYTKHQ